MQGAGESVASYRFVWSHPTDGSVLHGMIVAVDRHARGPRGQGAGRFSLLLTAAALSWISLLGAAQAQPRHSGPRGLPPATSYIPCPELTPPTEPDPPRRGAGAGAPKQLMTPAPAAPRADTPSTGTTQTQN